MKNFLGAIGLLILMSILAFVYYAIVMMTVNAHRRDQGFMVFLLFSLTVFLMFAIPMAIKDMMKKDNNTVN